MSKGSGLFGTTYVCMVNYCQFALICILHLDFSDELFTEGLKIGFKQSLACIENRITATNLLLT